MSTQTIVKNSMAFLPDFSPATGDAMTWIRSFELVTASIEEELNSGEGAAKLKVAAKFMMMATHTKLMGQAKNWYLGKFGYDDEPSPEQFVIAFKEEYLGTAHLADAWLKWKSVSMARSQTVEEHYAELTAIKAGLPKDAISDEHFLYQFVNSVPTDLRSEMLAKMGEKEGWKVEELRTIAAARWTHIREAEQSSRTVSAGGAANGRTRDVKKVRCFTCRNSATTRVTARIRTRRGASTATRSAMQARNAKGSKPTSVRRRRGWELPRSRAR
jgi:hypothetical protein